MGIHRKYFAVPFDVLTIVPEQRVFIFDQSRESFENHPGFNKKHWPLATSIPSFHDPIVDLWGLTPARIIDVERL